MVRVVGRLRHQDFSDLTTETWILFLRLWRRMIDDFRGEHERSLGVDHRDAIGNRRHVFLMKGNQPPGLDQDLPPRRGLPEDLAVEGAILHVQDVVRSAG